MIYFTWTIYDDFNSFEVIGEKGESNEAIFEKARAKYKEIVTTPGVTNIEVYFQTIDVRFASNNDAKQYTYLCNVDQVSFAKMCARSINTNTIIKPRQWNGKYFIDEYGNPMRYYFIKSKYRSVKELTNKAKTACKERDKEYKGLLAFYSVFHAA
jgi:hypothetical protein